MIYYTFVQSFPQLFDRSLTKSNRSFKRMAKVILTRTAAQCRSHHQKMLNGDYVQYIAELGAWMNKVSEGQSGEFDPIKEEMAKVEQADTKQEYRPVASPREDVRPNSIKAEFTE